MKIHPAADAFPMFDAARFKELCDDIATNGQREAIKLYDGMILDGRNRAKACEKLKIEPKTETLYDNINPWSYVWSLNGQRRDLVDRQRVEIHLFCIEQSEAWRTEQQRIRDEANKKRSEAAIGNKNASIEFQKEIARRSNVKTDLENSEGYKVSRTVSKHPERKAIAAAAQVSAPTVQKALTLRNKRPDLAAKVRTGEIRPAEADRQMKRDEVSKKAAALPVDKFRIIYADPPWKYGDGRTGDLMTATGALHHYPTMALSELKALDVRSLGADDSVLFLWATSPLLPDALELAAAWGFKYKASFVWDKVRHNLGTYNSVRHEFLLVCTRGSATPEVSKLFDSVQVIEKTDKHSEKPEEFRAIIDTLYPTGNRIELFRRGEAPKGWQVYGNEC